MISWRASGLKWRVPWWTWVSSWGHKFCVRSPYCSHPLCIHFLGVLLRPDWRPLCHNEIQFVLKVQFSKTANWRPAEDMGSHDQGRPETPLRITCIRPHTMENGLGESFLWARARSSSLECLCWRRGQLSWWCRLNPLRVNADPRTRKSFWRPGREAGYSFLVPWWIGLLEICWWGAIPEPPSGLTEEMRTYGRQLVRGDVGKAVSTITLETGNSIEVSFTCSFVTPSKVKYVFLHGARVGCLTCQESSSSVLLSPW